jgi:hypothetical protein
MIQYKCLQFARVGQHWQADGTLAGVAVFNLADTAAKQKVSMPDEGHGAD